MYDPQQLNRYAFERNNPYRYVDRDGHDPATLIALTIAGGIAVIGLTALGNMNNIAAANEAFTQAKTIANNNHNTAVGDFNNNFAQLLQEKGNIDPYLFSELMQIGEGEYKTINTIINPELEKLGSATRFRSSSSAVKYILRNSQLTKYQQFRVKALYSKLKDYERILKKQRRASNSGYYINGESVSKDEFYKKKEEAKRRYGKPAQ